MKRVMMYFWCVVLCFTVGLSASYFQADSLETWYPLLNKPAITPPNWAFPIAWGIIYVAMGISLGRLIVRRCRRELIVLWAAQLVANFLWSILFFLMRNPLLGLIDMLVLDVLVITYIRSAYRCDRWASWLFIPYVLWLALATYLNVYIYLYN